MGITYKFITNQVIFTCIACHHFYHHLYHSNNLLIRQNYIWFDYLFFSNDSINWGARINSRNTSYRIISHISARIYLYNIYLSNYCVYLQCASIDVLIYHMSIHVTSKFPSSKVWDLINHTIIFDHKILFYNRKKLLLHFYIFTFYIVYFTFTFF